MNVLDVMPTEDQIPRMIDFTECVELMKLRHKRFTMLTKIESERQGFVKNQADISTPNGQEMLRILMQRTLEEAGESFESTDGVHRKEEVIDAVNFMWAGFLLDPHLFSIRQVAQLLNQSIIVATISHGWVDLPLDYYDLGVLTYELATRIGDYLRNRPWHQNAQDQYFAGREAMILVWMNAMKVLLKVFKSPGEFWAFFMAKDRVLEFRIQTQY